jgi:DNA-directed RNA polymerase subunit RPC12/RpoP
MTDYFDEENDFKYFKNENDTYVRCDKSFCQNSYKVLIIPKSNIEKEVCAICGNKFEKVSENQAKEYFGGMHPSTESIHLNNQEQDSFESLKRSAKSFVNNPSDKVQNIFTIIIVIVAFILLVAYCGDTSDGPPRFFGDVR